jgi:hypothetical protein
LTGESRKNVAATSKVLPLQSGRESFVPKAVNCMLLEVCGGRLVFFILITPNAWCLTLAFLGSTGEDLDDAAIVLLDGDIRMKKRIYPRAPGLFSSNLRMKSITENEKKY